MSKIEINTLLSAIENYSIILISLSSPKSSLINSVIIRPVSIKNSSHYQLTEQLKNKAIHENLTPKECASYIEKNLNNYKQAIFKTDEADYQVLINKKDQMTILKKNPTKKLAITEHNKTKHYLIPEGIPVPYLVVLGIMHKDGKVIPKKRDKFRQINRFLEFIRDVLPALPKEKKLRIIDFGCGKAYLTFALYHYLKDIEGYNLQVEGLDLKEDVIKFCQKLSDQLGYKNLHFSVGNIDNYQPEAEVDMVVTLHACDIATDHALRKAVEWKSKVILSVPCCQHELFSQIKNEDLHSILRHGILKERFAAIATDAARVEMLEAVGYKTQILEFIDLEHTPKNLLIRAVKSKKNPEALKRYEKFVSTLLVKPSIESLKAFLSSDDDRIP